ncbi:MAG TPA: asparagine synthase-related protein [Magnetospirillum sp.]|nr:asparagine synthase-related protein [Magnetospirillum sp.]
MLARPMRPGGAAALFDGRLDNADEIARALGRRGEKLAPDVLSILAHERWGDEFLDRFVGDFACAVWDAAGRRLILGRDPMGMRPLHYWLGHDQFLFASEPRGLLAVPQIPMRIDERYLAEWLSILPQRDGATIYQGVERVPQGHMVVVRDGRVATRRYWHPERLPRLKLRRDGDYAEAVRATLDEAVRCRLPPSGLVGSSLSGGLDSSGVTALAARQLAAQGRRLTAFTAVPGTPQDPALHPGWFCDEGPLAATVAQAYPNVDHVLVRNDASPLLEAMRRRNVAVDAPPLVSSNVTWVDAIAKEEQRRGIRVHLGASSGNFTTSYDGVLALYALLRQGRLRDLARTIRHLRQDGRGWLGIANQTLRPFFPPALYARLRRITGKAEPAFYEMSALNPDFLREMGVEDRAAEFAGDMMNARVKDPMAWRVACLLRNDRGMVVAGSQRLYDRDVRDPTADRRLVELCLTIPEEQFLLHGQRRSLIRRALAGIVPQAILDERRKGLQSADWHVGFATALPEMMEEIRRLEASPLARRCLDLPRIRRLLEEWPGSDWHRPEIWQTYKLAVTRAVAAGQFIRRIEGGNG